MELKKILVKKSCTLNTYITRYAIKIDENGCAHYIEYNETLEGAQKTFEKLKDECILISQPNMWKFPD